MSGQRVEYMAMYLAEVGTLAVCCMIAFSLIRKLCFLHFLRFALVAFFEFGYSMGRGNYPFRGGITLLHVAARNIEKSIFADFQIR